MKKIQTNKNIKKIKKKNTKLREEIGEFLPYISYGLF